MNYMHNWIIWIWLIRGLWGFDFGAEEECFGDYDISVFYYCF